VKARYTTDIYEVERRELDKMIQDVSTRNPRMSREEATPAASKYRFEGLFELKSMAGAMTSRLRTPEIEGKQAISLRLYGRSGLIINQ
jgi:hypothetical protein